MFTLESIKQMYHLNKIAIFSGWFYMHILRYLGDIQIGMVNKKGQLEVEVIRARGLIQKPGSKSLPGESFLLYCLWFKLHMYHIIQPHNPSSNSRWYRTQPNLSELVILDMFSKVSSMRCVNSCLIWSILFNQSSVCQSLPSTQWGVCS